MTEIGRADRLGALLPWLLVGGSAASRLRLAAPLVAAATASPWQAGRDVGILGDC